MTNDQPTSEERRRFEEEARVAAEYIANNVRGRMVPEMTTNPVPELYPYMKERASNEDLPSAN